MSRRSVRWTPGPVGGCRRGQIDLPRGATRGQDHALGATAVDRKLDAASELWPRAGRGQSGIMLNRVTGSEPGLGRRLQGERVRTEGLERLGRVACGELGRTAALGVAQCAN